MSLYKNTHTHSCSTTGQAADIGIFLSRAIRHPFNHMSEIDAKTDGKFIYIYRIYEYIDQIWALNGRLGTRLAAQKSAQFPFYGNWWDYMHDKRAPPSMCRNWVRFLWLASRKSDRMIARGASSLVRSLISGKRGIQYMFNSAWCVSFFLYIMRKFIAFLIRCGRACTSFEFDGCALLSIEVARLLVASRSEGPDCWSSICEQSE